MLKLLHISHDEKFIDRGLSYFYEDERIFNSLLLVTDKDKNEHVLTSEDYKLRTENSADIKLIAVNYDVIVFHSLSSYFLRAIEDIDGKFLVWIGFGYDYYDLVYKTKYHMMMNETKKFYIERVSSLDSATLDKQIAEATFPYKKIELIKRINMFCPVLLNEYHLLHKYVEYLPEYSCWNYVYEEFEHMFKDGCFSANKSIIVGNSADPSNNHLDILEKIKKIKFDDDIKLITPLSYGNEKYADELELEFSAFFGSSYVSLRDFISLKDYYNILLSANTCIMAHKRQQGLGNLIMMLKLGYRIFMNEDSPAYLFLRDNGIIVYPLGMIDVFAERITEPLELSVKYRNSRLISEIFSYERNKVRTKEMIDKMYNFYNLCLD